MKKVLYLLVLFLHGEVSAQFEAMLFCKESNPDFDMNEFKIYNESGDIPLTFAQVASVNRQVRSQKTIYSLYVSANESVFQFEEELVPWLSHPMKKYSSK